MSNPIYRIDKNSIVTYEVLGPTREDEYGCYLPANKELKDFYPKEKDYGVYTVIDSQVLRFTPSMSLIAGYKYNHDIKKIVKADEIGTIGLGYIEFQPLGIEYDNKQKHYSELKPLDRFRFVKPFTFSETFTLKIDKEYTFDPKNEYIYLSGEKLRFTISDLNGEVFNINYWTWDPFVYIIGKAKFC